MLTLLSTVLPRTPNTVLRSKFAGSAALVGGLLTAHAGDAATAKAALGCLAQVGHGVWRCACVVEWVTGVCGRQGRAALGGEASETQMGHGVWGKGCVRKARRAVWGANALECLPPAWRRRGMGMAYPCGWFGLGRKGTTPCKAASFAGVHQLYGSLALRGTARGADRQRTAHSALPA